MMMMLLMMMVVVVVVVMVNVVGRHFERSICGSIQSVIWNSPVLY
jgi:hypothetical protein